MRTKINIINHHLSLSEYEIFCLQETWLNANITNIEITHGTNYDIFRQDRSETSNEAVGGGGVATLASKNLQAQRIKLCILKPHIEIVAIIFILNAIKYIVINVYNVPYNQSQNIEEFIEIVEDIKQQHPNANISIVGDFNFPAIEWREEDDDVNGLSPLINNLNTPILDDFLYFVSAQNLFQVNSCPNSNGKFLDLLFSNDPANSICRIPHVDTLIDKNSHHHNAICLEIITNNVSSTLIENTPNLFRTNLKKSHDELCKILPILNTAIYSSNDIETRMKMLSDVVSSCSSRIARHDDVSTHPWLKNDVQYRTLKKKQNSNYKKYKNSHLQLDKTQYIVSLNNTRNRYTYLRDKYYQNAISTAKKNPSSMFTLARTRRTSKESIPTDMTYEATPVFPSDRDRVFCDQFASNFTSDSFPPQYKIENGKIDFHQIYSDFQNDQYAHLFHDFDIKMSPLQLDEYVKEIDVKKDAGPLQISLQFIVFNWQLLKGPLHDTFNYILETGDIPDSFKKSYIVPIPKKGSIREISNYRGIALQSIFPKILDKHVTNVTSYHMSSIISPFQHGFMKHRSTISNLLEITQEISEAIAQKTQLDCVYFDFSKAFDRIDHFILSKKLANLSLPFQLFNFILNFTVNRTYILKINSIPSLLFFLALSGVPQGSHLGPLLYLLYCNDIPAFIKGVKILMYADDTKLYSQVKNMQDQITMQIAIDALASWASQNKLTLNPAKTVKLSYFKSRQSFITNYSLSDEIIGSVTTHKDLGIIFDEKLSFNEHIATISRRSIQLTGAIYRLITDIRCPSLTMQLFKSFVLPVLEYGSCIWNRNIASQSSILDTPLRNATRIALRAPKFPFQPHYVAFADRLALLQLHSLSERRLFQLTSTFLKILSHELHSPINFQILAQCINLNPTVTRRPNFFINMLKFSQSNSPTFLAMTSINSLSAHNNIYELSIIQIKKILLPVLPPIHT